MYKIKKSTKFDGAYQIVGHRDNGHYFLREWAISTDSGAMKIKIPYIAFVGGKLREDVTYFKYNYFQDLLAQTYKL